MAKVIAARGFKERIAVSNQFLNEIIEDLECWGFSYAINGTEHTHPDFIKEIRTLVDPVSLFIRYEPDVVICAKLGNGDTPISFLLEVKAGQNIERAAYEEYMKHVSLGHLIAIVFKCGAGNKYWNFVEEIRFIPSKEVVEKFPNPFHIDQGGWIDPRKTPYWMENARWNNPQASGTPYKRVDFKSLLNWDEFRDKFVAKSP